MNENNSSTTNAILIILLVIIVGFIVWFVVARRSPEPGINGSTASSSVEVNLQNGVSGLENGTTTP